MRQPRAAKIQTSRTTAKGRNRCGLTVQNQSAAPAAKGRDLCRSQKERESEEQEDGGLAEDHAVEGRRKAVAEPVEMFAARAEQLPENAH